jgi:tetratricopeptide (TPR) repeat protein
MNPDITATPRVTACNVIFRVTAGSAGRATILWYRADAKLAAGDHAGAIADADQANALLPDNADVLNAQCWSRAVANRDLDKARAACNRSLQKEKSGAALDSRGLVSLRQGRWLDAWNDYDDAMSVNPSMTVALYGRGLAALALGKTEEGERDIRDARAAAQIYARLGLTPELMKRKARANQTPGP